MELKRFWLESWEIIALISIWIVCIVCGYKLGRHIGGENGAAIGALAGTLFLFILFGIFELIKKFYEFIKDNIDKANEILGLEKKIAGRKCPLCDADLKVKIDSTVYYVKIMCTPGCVRNGTYERL